MADVISVDDAVKALAGGTPEEQPAPEAQELPEADEADSELPEELEAEAEEDEDSEPTEEQQEQDEDEEEPTFTVRVNGKEEEVTLDELTSGYLRQADYTRSKQAIAEQRKAFEAQTEQVGQRLAQLDQEFQSIEQLLMGTPPEMPPIELLHSNPTAYETQRRAVQEWEATKHQVDTWRKTIAEERTKETQAKLAEAVKAEGQKMVEAFSIKDEAGMNAKVGEIQQYLVDNGYQPGEIANLVDHRAYILADKARRWDELHSKSAAGRLKAKKAKAKSVSSSARVPKIKREGSAKSRFNETLNNPNATRKTQIDAGVAAYLESQRG